MRALAFIAAVFVSSAAFAQAEPPLEIGKRYAISIHRESEQRSSDGGSSTSSDRYGWIEQVIARTDAGLELEYDLPADATAEDRAREWQFPARVLKPSSGPLQLLNRAQLEGRVESWLQRAKWTRAACGSWIFTWNAFRIECDPQSVIATLEALDLRPGDLRDGALYRDAKAREPVVLITKSSGPDRTTFGATLPIDPTLVRRERAEADVVVGEIMGKPATLDAALVAHSAEEVSGTIEVSIEVHSSGLLRRRTKITKLEIKTPGGAVETAQTTETLERKMIE